MSVRKRVRGNRAEEHDVDGTAEEEEEGKKYLTYLHVSNGPVCKWLAGPPKNHQ